jgi:predicted secreted protein
MSGASLAGVNTKGLTIGFEPIDVSDDNSAGYRELLAEPGSKTLDLAVSGATKSLELLRASSENTSQIYPFVFTYEDGSTLTMDAFMSSFAITAESATGSTFDASFQSSGDWVFAVAP